MSRYFRKPLSPRDVVESFFGVRPLYDDGARDASAAARDYVLDLEAPSGCAPLLSVFGGKITTYRRLAEDALELLSPHLKPPCAPRWTATAPLPGGDMEGGDFDRFLHTLRGKYPWLDAATVVCLARAYGTRAEMIFGKARRADDLGVDFGAGLFQAEIDYLIGQEFALTAEDILWRRSKLRWHLPILSNCLRERLRGRAHPDWQASQCLAKPISSRSIRERPRREVSLFDASGRLLASAQREFSQVLSAAGLGRSRSAHDLARRAAHRARGHRKITCVGCRDRHREPAGNYCRLGPRGRHAGYPAIVWQDRRTAAECERLRRRTRRGAGSRPHRLASLPLFSRRPNLPGGSITLRARGRARERGELAFGTIDSFLLGT